MKDGSVEPGCSGLLNVAVDELRTRGSSAARACVRSSAAVCSSMIACWYAVACCNAACVALCTVIGCVAAAEAGGVLGTPGSDGACGCEPEVDGALTEGVLDGDGCVGCAGGAVCAAPLPAAKKIAATSRPPRNARGSGLDRSRLKILRR